MPTHLHDRIAELEAVNRRLREKLSWAAIRLRGAADNALAAIGDLELAALEPDAVDV